jgi:hypothetical protein
LVEGNMKLVGRDDRDRTDTTKGQRILSA